MSVLVLPKELTQAQATACLRTLVLGLPLQSGSDVVLDASGLSRFDSSALAVLLEFRRETLRLGKRLSIQSWPSRLLDLAKLYGIDALLAPAAPALVK